MPKLFISYRRADNAYAARQIHASLSEHFDNDNVIFDVESIPIGEDFRAFLNEQVSQCDVLLAIIGKEWLKILNERSNDLKDFVRIEIETALSRDIPVLPVLVDNALMPGETDLPQSIVELASINAITVRADADFSAQIERLITGLESLLEKEKVRKRELAKKEQDDAKRAKQEQERLERERLAREKQEQLALEREKLEHAKQEQMARLEQQALVRDSIELQKQAQAKLEHDKLAQQQEQMRLDRNRLEQETQARELSERAKQQQMHIEQAKLAQQQEQLRIERERSEREAQEKQKQADIERHNQLLAQQEQDKRDRDAKAQTESTLSVTPFPTKQPKSTPDASTTPRWKAPFSKVALLATSAVVLAGVTALFGFISEKTGTDNLLNDAKKEIEAEHYPKAISLYQTVLKREPNNLVAKNELEYLTAMFSTDAQSALKTYDITTANEYLGYIEMINLNPSDITVLKSEIAHTKSIGEFADNFSKALATKHLRDAKQYLDQLTALDPKHTNIKTFHKQYLDAIKVVKNRLNVAFEKVIDWGKQISNAKPAPVTSITFSHDGKSIVTGGYNPNIYIVNTLRGKTSDKTDKIPVHNVSSVASSADGSRVVSGNFDMGMCIWNVQTDKSACVPNSSGSGLSVSINHDGTQIVSGNYDGSLQIWNAQNGERIGDPIKPHTKAVRSVAFSPDGSRIVSGSEDKTICLWDIKTGKIIAKTGHKDSVMSVAFSPDGTRVVSGSWDTTLRIWDAATGEPIGEALKGHQNGVNSVAFSPDGKTIVSGSIDKTLRLWDTDTGVQIGEPIKGHTKQINSVAFSPNGTQLVSGGYDGTIRLWDVHAK